MKYKNIFKCECGNHQGFSALQKAHFDETLLTNCDFCGKISDMQFVKSKVIK